MTGISCLSGGAVEPATVLDELVRLGFELGPSEPYQVMVLDTPDARLVRAGARLDARPVYQPNSADAVELRVRGDAVPDRPVVVSRLPRTTRDLPAGRFRTVVGDLLRERALGVRMSFASSCAHALLRAADGAPQARIELHTEVVVHDERGRRREVAPDWCIELHLVGDRIKPVRRVQRRLRDLGLAVLAGDVLVWASDRGDVDLTGRQRHRRPTMRRREPAADVFRRVLHAYGDTIGDSWQGTVDDLDPEYLHELRVALRSGRSVWRAASRRVARRGVRRCARPGRRARRPHRPGPRPRRAGGPLGRPCGRVDTRAARHPRTGTRSPRPSSRRRPRRAVRPVGRPRSRSVARLVAAARRPRPQRRPRRRLRTTRRRPPSRSSGGRSGASRAPRPRPPPAPSVTTPRCRHCTSCARTASDCATSSKRSHRSPTAVGPASTGGVICDG
ncbi:MAG: hypothetical protein R2713_10950 [Ilumatobacteraceae bacterium]